MTRPPAAALLRRTSQGPHEMPPGPELAGHETRRLISQSGAFGEHRFTGVRYPDENGGGHRVVPVAGRYLAVELPPAAAAGTEE